MIEKIYIILSNFFCSMKKREFFELFVLPCIFTVLIYIVCNSSINEFKKFIDDFNNIIINITSILGAFSLATLSIIITSSNNNIECAKETIIERKDRLKKYITYYKLQILRNFFSLFTLFGLLFYSIMFKFMQNLVSNIEFFFYFEVYMLIVAVISQIFVIQSMYFLFVEPKQ
ncbi:MAG: hypothetical protein ACRC7N_21110 [Clostridium sp.]